MEKEKTQSKASKLVSFFEKEVMSNPKKVTELPMLTDSDRFKLPSMKKLLECMHNFHAEMKSVGLHLENKEKGVIPDSFDLSSKQYGKDCGCEFYIFIQSPWLDPKFPFSIHAGFSLLIYINQRVHPEISDIVDLRIKYCNTEPFSLASARRCDRHLSSFYSGPQFFNNLELGDFTNITYNLNNKMSFKTPLFNQTIKDACEVMNKIIEIKETLTVRESEL